MLEKLSRKERNSTIKAFAKSPQNQLYKMFYDYYNAKHFAMSGGVQQDYKFQPKKLMTRSGSPLSDSKKDDTRLLVVSNWCEPVVSSIADFTSGTDDDLTIDDKKSQAFWKEQKIRKLIDKAAVKTGIYGLSFLRYQENEKVKQVKVIEPTKIYEVINSITGEVESIIHYYLISKEDAQAIHPELAFPKGDIYYAEEFSKTELHKYIDGQLVNPGKTLSPYAGTIPFFKIKTNSEGKSDLMDVIPLNDEINLTYTNIDEIIKYHAFPIYAPKGSGLKDNIVNVQDENFKQIEISPRKIMNFPIERIESGGINRSIIEHIESVKSDISVVSKVPMKLLMGEMDGNISGVALQRMMSGVIKQAEKRRGFIKDAIKEINKLAVGDKEIEVTLPPMLKSDEGEQLDNAIKKESIGISRETIYAELGYEYTEETAKREKELDNQISRLDDEANSITEQNQGGKTGSKKTVGVNKSVVKTK